MQVLNMAAFHQEEQQTQIQIQTIRVGPGSIQDLMSSPSSNESSTSSSPCSSSGSFVSCPTLVSQTVVNELANTLSKLSLHTPPEPPQWCEEELDRLSYLTSSLAHLTDPVRTFEQLEHPVLDWEIPSALRHLPYSSYSL